MARYNQKRKRSYGRPYASKKRKTNFKRRRPAKSTDFTSLNTRGTNVGFRSRKTSRKTFRKHLWNSTLFSTHWRSVFGYTQGFSTPASYTTGTLVGTNMYKPTAGPFYTAAGGTLPPDITIPIPFFVGNIIVRGGVYDWTFHNDSTTDMKVKIFMLKTTKSPDFTFEPVAPYSSWDPSATPDFHDQIGATWMTKEVLIEGGNAYTYKGRFPIQKIDQATYLLSGSSPVIYSLTSNVGTTAASAYRITAGYNLSFSADAQ